MFYESVFPGQGMETEMVKNEQLEKAKPGLTGSIKKPDRSHLFLIRMNTLFASDRRQSIKGKQFYDNMAEVFRYTSSEHKQKELVFSGAEIFFSGGLFFFTKNSFGHAVQLN